MICVKVANYTMGKKKTLQHVIFYLQGIVDEVGTMMKKEKGYVTIPCLT
jgi:hypothetical protein